MTKAAGDFAPGDLVVRLGSSDVWEYRGLAEWGYSETQLVMVLKTPVGLPRCEFFAEELRGQFSLARPDLLDVEDPVAS